MKPTYAVLSIVDSTNGYHIDIAINNLTPREVMDIYEEILDGGFNWDRFEKGDKLWYADGSQYVYCEQNDPINKDIYFAI